MVDKLRTVIAVDAQEGEGEVGTEFLESLDDPFLGFIEEWAEFHPAGIDIGGGEGEAKLTGIPFSTVMNGIDLEKPGFSFVPGVMGPNGDMLF